MSSSAFDLNGRVALVTGAGRGIGLGAATGLAEAGATVIMVSRTAAQLDAAVADLHTGGFDAHALPFDLGDGSAAPALVEQVIAQHGRLDVLVHAAGNMVRKPSLDLTTADWDFVLGLHLRTAFLLSQAAGEHMLHRGTGSIILIGSMTSERVGIPTTAAYAVAKSGLLGLMRTLAVEWAAGGVRVNTIAPGFFPTAMNADIETSPDRQALYNRIPMGRPGKPADIAGVAAFFASDASRYVTGEVVSVDGGWSVA